EACFHCRSRENILMSSSEDDSGMGRDEKSTSIRSISSRAARTQEASTPVTAEKQGVKKRKLGEANRSLEEVLAAAIVMESHMIGVKQGDQRTASVKSSNESIIPVKFFKPEDLMGLHVWTEKTYSDVYIIGRPGRIEIFADREVGWVISYVVHGTDPFVLVKLGLKKNEGTIRVKDIVQGVHFPLALRLFPKACTSFMNRVMTYQMNNGKDDGSSSTATRRIEN
ncbi:hypothetical protein PMAYCL1PPCAC_25227, partial [Pristionchus mayeri]